MPGTVKKVDGFQSKWGGKVVAKNTTKKKAMSQQRLLRAIEHGFKPTPQQRIDGVKKAFKLRGG